MQKEEFNPLSTYYGILLKKSFKIYGKPFKATGTDYFELYLIKVYRKLEKSYGVSSTCLTTWAIHVEIADLLIAASSVMAICRIMARR